jgi:hypothetical protein
MTNQMTDMSRNLPLDQTTVTDTSYLPTTKRQKLDPDPEVTVLESMGTAKNLPSKLQVPELRGKRNNEQGTSPPPQHHQQQGVVATSPNPSAQCAPHHLGNANNTHTCRLPDGTPNGSTVAVATAIHATPKTIPQSLFPPPQSPDDIPPNDIPPDDIMCRIL